MPNLRGCHCRNSYKSKTRRGTPDIMEFTTFFKVVFWIVLIILTVIFVASIHFAILHFIVGVGSLAGEPVRVLNETEETKLRNMPLAEHTFTFQPEKVKTGCEYWFNYISTMDATAEEKDWVQKIVRCESTCNPNAISHMGAIGISQITPPTWQDFGGDRDINNPYHQLEVTLEMYRNGFRQRWCCDQLI